MSQTLKTHHPNNQEKGKEAEQPGTDENLSRPSAEPKLLDQLTEAAERCGHTVEAAKGMADWCRRYVLFHSKRHPREMGVPEIGRFLQHVAVTEKDALRMLETAMRQRNSRSSG